MATSEDREIEIERQTDRNLEQYHMTKDDNLHCLVYRQNDEICKEWSYSYYVNRLSPRTHCFK